MRGVWTLVGVILGLSLVSLAAAAVPASAAPAPAAPAPVAAVITDPPAPLPGRLGPHKVAVIVLSFDTQASIYSTAQARSIVFTGERSARRLYKQSTKGQITLVGVRTPVNGDVFGIYTVHAPLSEERKCQSDAWHAQARQLAAVDGYVEGAYDSVVVVFPYTPNCGWFGFADLPGSRVFINGVLFGGIAAHEIGHNLGLEHAGSKATCKNGSPNVDCSFVEYGDPYDVMGRSPEHLFSGWNRWRLGALSESEVLVVRASGTYTFQASDITTPGRPRLLFVPSKVRNFDGTQAWLTLETRARFGSFDDFPANDPVVNGVSVRRVAYPTFDNLRSWLLDPTPRTLPFDAPIPAGKQLPATLDNVKIEVQSVAGGVATVKITL